MKIKLLEPKFVELIPDIIEEGIIYISIEHCVAVHKCACGCKNKVTTPLAPDMWELKFNGESISLYPSIGNYYFECKSHYWIKNNLVIDLSYYEVKHKIKKRKKKKWESLFR